MRVQYPQSGQLTISVNGQVLNNKLLGIGPVTNTQPLVSIDRFTPQNWIMYDPDAPYPQFYPRLQNSPPSATTKAYLHWIRQGGVDVVPFTPPAPPIDSPPHRYIFVSYQGEIPRQISRNLHHGFTDISTLFQFLHPESIGEYSAVATPTSPAPAPAAAAAPARVSASGANLSASAGASASAASGSASINRNPYARFDAPFYDGDFKGYPCIQAPVDQLVCGQVAVAGDSRSDLEKVASCIFQMKARIGNDIRTKGWSKYSASAPFAICQKRLGIGIGAVAFKFRPEILNTYSEDQLRGWIVYEANFSSEPLLSREIFERIVALSGKSARDLSLETRLDYLDKQDLIMMILRYWHCKPPKIARRACVAHR